MITEDIFNQRIHGIRSRFIASLGGLQKDFATLQQSIGKPGSHPDAAISELNYHAHRIRGIAPVLGLTKLGEIAHETEELTADLLEAAMPSVEICDVAEALERFQQEISRAVSV